MTDIRSDEQSLADALANDGEADRIVSMLEGLVEPLGRSYSNLTEVILHDLRKLPNSIVAVHGDVTGRSVGDPATDLLLEYVVSGSLENRFMGYRTMLPDGRRMKSSTMIVRDSAGAPVAALCVNSDISGWETVRDVVDTMLGQHDEEPPRPARPVPVAPERPTSPEMFVRDVDELASHLMRQAIEQTGVPVEQMRKEHKLQVVQTLKSKGMFLLRDAAENIATTLGVSRFTIYNYLSELAEAEGNDAAAKEDPQE